MIKNIQLSKHSYIKLGAVVGLFLIAASVALSIAFGPKAEAASVSGRGYFTGRSITISSIAYRHDVLSGRDSTGAGQAIPVQLYNGRDDAGTAGANDKEEFYNWIKYRYGLSTTSSRDKTGIAFIVKTMLGQSGATSTAAPKSKAVTAAEWTSLRARIMNPSISVGFLNADPNNYGRVSFYSTTDGDTLFTGYNSGSRGLMVFRDASQGGKVVYVLEIPCANPLGYLSLPNADNKPAVTITASCNTKTLSGTVSDPDWPSGNNMKVHLIIPGYPRGESRGYALSTNGRYSFNINDPTFMGNSWSYNVKVFSYDSSGRELGSSYATNVLRFGPCQSDVQPDLSIVADCNELRGTVTDRNAPGVAVRVELYIGGVLRSTTTSNTSTKEFGFNISSYTSAMTTFTVRAYNIGLDGRATTSYVSDSESVGGGSCAVASCGERIGSTVVIGSQVSISPKVIISSWSTPPFSASSSPQNPTMVLSIKAPNGSITNHTLRYSVTLNGGRATLTGVHMLTPSVAGHYDIVWRVTSSNTPSVNVVCDGGAKGGGGKVKAGTRPYFDVYGGDILAGIASSGSEDPASVIAWNQGEGPWSGAGGNLAAIATGDLDGFVSQKGGNPPKGLSFANDTGNPTYGGGFEAAPTKQAISELFASDSGGSIGGLVNLGGLESGVYSITGDAIISGVVGSGKNITIIVSGDIYIEGNITYGAYTLATVPRLNLITTNGNIVIGSNVSEVHGVIAAEGSGAGGGKVYTCGVRNAEGIIGYEYSQLGEHSCGTGLKVVGTVMADEIVLGRTSGSWVGGANLNPAERFMHGPETWLSVPYGGVGAGSYDSYIGLPPTL